MAKTLKTIFYLFIIVIVLVLGAAVLIPLFIDPNDHKDRIAALVKQQTGRDIYLENDIRLAVFPWLALELGRTRLGNAAGFSEPDFARVQRVHIRLKLRPLLRKEIEMDTLELHGLELYLSRDASGRGNWEDLGGRSGAGGSAPAPAFHINGINLSDARIHWQDAASGAHYSITGASLRTGALAPAQALELELGFTAHSEAQALTADIQVRGRVLPDFEHGIHQIEQLQIKAVSALLPGGEARLELEQLRFNRIAGKLEWAMLELTALGAQVQAKNLHMNLGGEFYGTLSSVPFNPRVLLQQLGLSVSVPDNLLHSAHFSADFSGNLDSGALSLTKLRLEVDDNRANSARVDANFKQQNLHIEQLELNLFDIVAQVQIRVEQLFSAPQYEANLRIDTFDPQAVFAKIGLAPLNLRDPDALRQAGLAFELKGNHSALSLSKFQLNVDQTQAQAQITVENLQKPAFRFNLEIDQLNLDRYLPPASDSSSPQTDAPLPLDAVRTLDMNGNIKITRLLAAGLEMEDVRLTVKAHAGKLELSPAARLYGGATQGRLDLDAATKPPQMRLQNRLSGVQAGPLLDDWQNGEGIFTGQAELNTQLRADASTVASLRQSLDGNIDFAIRDGAYKGFNLGEKLRQARALLKGQSLPASTAPQQTDFTELNGAIAARQGVLHFDALNMKAPLLRVSGDGFVSLHDNAMDIHLHTSVVETSSGQDGRDLEALKGLTIPVTLSGTLDAPQAGVDVKAMAAALARKEGQKQLEKHDGALTEKLEQKLGPDAGGKARELLKKLF
jgi:AsmA protein